jgi:signal transduction histidine kinase
MLAKGTLGPLSERQVRVSESMREQSLRLEHQIDKLIDLGRLDTSDFGQDREVFKLSELMAVAVEPFRCWAADQKVELIITPPGDKVLVGADREDIKRALQALIENAVKFTPRGGRVEVFIRESDTTVTCVVRDSGIGLDVRYHKRIFEKFFQVEDPLTRHYGGAGLGLCVAKGIVEAHGSRIRVKSTLGEGSEFCFDLCRHSSMDVDKETNSSEWAAYVAAQSE